MSLLRTFLKRFCLSAMTAVALTAVAVPSAASATTLEVGGVAQNKSVELIATLKSGTSLHIEDEFGMTTDVCGTSEIKGKTEGTFTNTSIGGNVSALSFGNCTHSTSVDARGSFSISWTSGTNGNLISAGAEVTVTSTWWGVIALCKTGTGTKLGTITGTSSGHATIDLNAIVNCGIIGNATWTGTYTVTSPTGLGVMS